MKTVDCYDLLTRDQREQIADMMMEAMAFHNIYPDIWEMKVEAIIDSEDRPQEAEIPDIKEYNLEATE